MLRGPAEYLDQRKVEKREGINLYAAQGRVSDKYSKQHPPAEERAF